VRERRAGGQDGLAAVRAFYLDISQWAMEDRRGWALWPTLSRPPEEPGTQKEIVPQVAHGPADPGATPYLADPRGSVVNDERTTTVRMPAIGAVHCAWRSFTIDGRTMASRRDEPGLLRGADLDHTTPTPANAGTMTGEEDRAFWTWAAVETLRHTGIRIERSSPMLSHHSLIPVSAARHGEGHPTAADRPLQDWTAERLLVHQPRARYVLAAIITRVRCGDGTVGCVTSYDSPERVWNPPMPLLFQRGSGVEHRSDPADTLRGGIGRRSMDQRHRPAAGKPLRFTPHDFRRMFITDAVMHGMPATHRQLVAGHRDINTTMDTRPSPQEVINRTPSLHRSPAGSCVPAPSTACPRKQEWGEFLGHFRTTKVPSALVGRSYATACIHEHACLRCPLATARPCPAPSG